MYAIIPQQILQGKRADINEKILFAINSGKDMIPAESIYNCYTGIGGLHNLKQSNFANYHEYAEAKKEYHRLALENHPDKGGSTEVMQQINVEFERLHEIWKNDTTVSANASGYENDYAGASAKEYTDFVYNEYRWKGRNYQRQHTPEIVELVRNWMKDIYPKYKFSVSRRHYNSLHIYLVKADFEAFKKDKGVVFYHDVNHYHIDNNDTLTDRTKEVMKNVCDFVMSYNFDDSDPITDYFCTNF